MGVTLTNDGIKIFLDGGVNNDADRAYTPLSRLVAGRLQDDPTINDTALTNPLPINSAGLEVVDDCETADWTAGTDSINETLNATSQIQGTNSLNLGKSGTSGDSFSYSKTTTSIDFTNKHLFLFVYVETLTDLVASGTAITVRFGSDNSNYYYEDVDIDDLAIGWNTIELDQASPTGTTGTPTVTACDYSEILFYVDNNADLVTLGDVRMDYWHVASNEDFVKTFITGYPLGPDNSLNVEIRGEILDTDANGYRINGFGFSNTDSPALLGLVGKTITISKDASEQIIVSGKIRGRHI